MSPPEESIEQATMVADTKVRGISPTEGLDQEIDLHSNFSKIGQTFDDAEEEHQAHQQAAKLRKKVKSAFSRFREEFTREAADEVLSLLHRCVQDYPFSQHQASLKSRLEDTLDELLKRKDCLKVPLTNGGVKKKELQDQDFLVRLHYLSCEGVKALGQEGVDLLRDIKSSEQKKSVRDKIKAAVQRRIYLLDFDDTTIQSVVQWLYSHGLHFEDAGHLCKIYGLAEELGITALSEKCVSQLWNATWSAIDNAKKKGITLRALLNEEQPENEYGTDVYQARFRTIVPTVFKYVLGNKDAPDALQRLVVEAVADSRDMDVVKDTKPGISLKMAIQLNEALMARWANAPAASTHENISYATMPKREIDLDSASSPKRQRHY